MIYAKILGGIVVLLAIIGAFRWVSNTLDKAERAEAAEARVIEVEREKADLAKTFADSAKLEREIAKDIADFRAEQAARGQQLHDAIKAKPTHTEAIHVDAKTGLTSTCRERIPQRSFELFNQAVGPSYP